MKKIKDLKKWVDGYNAVKEATEELTLAFDFYKEEIVSEEEVDAAYANVMSLLEAIEMRNMLSSEEDNLGAVLKIVPANTADFQINFEAFEEMISEKTMAVLINTPNNPSGIVYSKETLEKLAAVLTAKSEEYGHDIFVISDEPYREIVFAGVDAPCVSSFYDNTIMCYSFSKSLSLPGERIGYVAINPACKEAETMVVMCGQISRGIGHNCPSSLIQLALPSILDKTSDLSVYETNKNILYNVCV